MSATAAVLNLPARRSGTRKAWALAAAIVLVMAIAATAGLLMWNRSSGTAVPRPAPSEVVGAVPKPGIENPIQSPGALDPIVGVVPRPGIEYPTVTQVPTVPGIPDRHRHREGLPEFRGR